MLDWAALIPDDSKGYCICPSFSRDGKNDPEQTSAEQRNWDKVSQSVPVKTASVPVPLGQPKPSNGKAYSRFFASVPVVPVKKHETGKRDEKTTAPGGSGPHDFCANVDEKGNVIYRANHAAVLLLLAWASLKKADIEERAALLLDLESLPPAEQVRYWHGVCLADGLKPWHILCLPAPLSGDDCTRCKNLTTREEALGEERRRIHWACRLGYLILEHGRGTERIYVAPPECGSYERWYPTGWR